MRDEMAPAPDGHQPDRRAALMLGGAAALAAAGLGWATWQKQAASRLSPEAAQALWQAEFEQPDGRPLSLAAFRGKPLVLNFWATWCPPCVKEIPLLVEFYRQQSSNGWQMIGLAIDQPTPVKRFMQELNMPYAVGLAGLNGTELMKILGNDRGGLPFTLVLDAKEGILQRKLGELHAGDLGEWLKKSSA